MEIVNPSTNDPGKASISFIAVFIAMIIHSINFAIDSEMNSNSNELIIRNKIPRNRIPVARGITSRLLRKKTREIL